LSIFFPETAESIQQGYGVSPIYECCDKETGNEFVAEITSGLFSESLIHLSVRSSIINESEYQTHFIPAYLRASVTF
jgi:hypothetical protein